MNTSKRFETRDALASTTVLLLLYGVCPRLSTSWGLATTCPPEGLLGWRGTPCGEAPSSVSNGRDRRGEAWKEGRKKGQKKDKKNDKKNDNQDKIRPTTRKKKHHKHSRPKLRAGPAEKAINITQLDQ